MGGVIIRLIIDTNIYFAAIIKNADTRKLIFHPGLSLYAPRYIQNEINKYHDMLIKRSKIDGKKFETLINSISINISIIEDRDILKCLRKATDLIGKKDEKDIPFLAAAICKNLDGIWSNDTDFDAQDVIRRYDTSELIIRFNI